MRPTELASQCGNAPESPKVLVGDLSIRHMVSLGAFGIGST